MCGIFGVLNKKNDTFDKLSFCGLGWSNDIRGGDSTGICIDREVEYGVNENKLFASFCQKSNLIKEKLNCKIAIGHCRKASIGKINVDNAHPIVINGKDKAELILIHNGTIINHKELAKKYLPKTDITDYSDTIIMALLYHQIGDKIFEEYNGAGVFVFIDYRNNGEKIIVFKGKSKLYKSSIAASEERPLYFLETEKSLWFSSLKESLERYVIMNNNFNCNIIDVEPNIVYTIIDGVIVQTKDINREDNYQTETVVYAQGYTNAYSNKNSYDDLPFDDNLDWNSYVSRFDNKNNTRIVKTTYGTSYKEKLRVKEAIFEIDRVKSHKETYKIMFSDGIYYYKDNPINGAHTVSPRGYILDRKAYNYNQFPTLYFFAGLILKGKYEYEALKTVCELFKYSPEDIAQIFPEIVYSYTSMPILKKGYNGLIYGQANLYEDYKIKKIDYSWTFPVLFETRQIDVSVYASNYLSEVEIATLDDNQYKKTLSKYFLCSDAESIEEIFESIKKYIEVLTPMLTEKHD